MADGRDPEDTALVASPAKRLAVVACMDTRYNGERVLGLVHGDAKIIRNAGRTVDDGTMRSLVVAVHLLGVENVAVMGHTKCGMTQVGRGGSRIAHPIADTSEVPLSEVLEDVFRHWLGGFEDVVGHVRERVAAVHADRYMPRALDVVGLVYDNDTGRITRVEP